MVIRFIHVVVTVTLCSCCGLIFYHQDISGACGLFPSFSRMTQWCLPTLWFVMDSHRPWYPLDMHTGVHDEVWSIWILRFSSKYWAILHSGCASWLLPASLQAAYDIVVGLSSSLPSDRCVEMKKSTFKTFAPGLLLTRVDHQPTASCGTGRGHIVSHNQDHGIAGLGMYCSGFHSSKTLTSLDSTLSCLSTLESLMKEMSET